MAEQPAVHWLAPRAALQLHNWQGSAIVQSGNAAPDAPVALAQDRGSHPIWAAGLTGAGQIVGAGDSGIGAAPAPRGSPFVVCQECLSIGDKAQLFSRPQLLCRKVSDPLAAIHLSEICSANEVANGTSEVPIYYYGLC